MKTIKNISVSIFALVMAFSMYSCKKDEPTPPSTQNIPKKFSVDIPSSLSRDESARKDLTSDTLNGNEIYWHLNTFIHFTENSAEFIQLIMVAISKHNINHAMQFSYVSQDDGRVKNAVVVENSSFENTTWEFQLTITDAASVSNADGGKALQVFWNTAPVKGIAIVKFYNANRTKWVDYPDAMYRVNYSEAGEGGYSHQMTVFLSDLPLADPLQNPYSLHTMKMFAGKSGNYVDVFGNSNHPNAKFFTSQTGFNWAFVASSNSTLNIAVAEVGIPESTLNSNDRIVILKDNSIKNVFTDQIYEVWPNVNSTDLANYLHNTTPPGYFNSNGFVQGGTAPSGDYVAIEGRMNTLTPYNPIDITNLSIEFKP